LTGDAVESEEDTMADITDFTKPYYSLSKLSGVKEVLVILWDPHRPDHPAPDKSDIDVLIFGTTATVKACSPRTRGAVSRLRRGPF
jgi:hypothetical protein